MLLLSTCEKKLIAKWQGPFEVLRKMGEVDYEIRMPGRKPETKVFHANLLKGWKVRRETGAEGEREEFGPSVQEILAPQGKVSTGKDVSPQQRQQVEKYRKKFSEVFSKKLGAAVWEEHKIKCMICLGQERRDPANGQKEPDLSSNPERFALGLLEVDLQGEQLHPFDEGNQIHN